MADPGRVDQDDTVIVHLDEVNGRAAVENGNGLIRLAPPSFRQWAEWSIEWEAQAALFLTEEVMVDVETRRVLLVGGRFWEDHPLHSEVVRLNREMLITVGAPINEDPTWDLCLGDRTLTAALLTFWRDRPLSPWDPDGVSPVDNGDEKRKIIRSTQRGIRGAMSVIYRALRDHDPATLDRLELWQIACLLGRDDPDDETEDDDQIPGARTRRNKHGNREHIGFRRNPRQRWLFHQPPQVTMN